MASSEALQSPAQSIDVQLHAFPARSKQSSGIIAGTRTDVSGFYFTDKIIVTISQEGRLAHWVHVPLEPASPAGITQIRTPPSVHQQQVTGNGGSNTIVPLPHLTATTIFGGVGSPVRETVGQLVATQLASALVTRNPDERRLLVLGLGLGDVDTLTSQQGAFAELMALIKQCL